jgi:hypothetical protein
LRFRNAIYTITRVWRISTRFTICADSGLSNTSILVYLLCYAWQRYRQLTENLVDALSYHMKQLEDESKARTDRRFVAEQAQREQETPRVGRLLLLYVDDAVADITPFGDVRQHAFRSCRAKHCRSPASA